MARYTVTIVSPDGNPQTRPTLLLPFEPNALVSAFVDELFRRIRKQDIQLAPNTHVATLHLDSETGAIIDTEDVLADVVDPNDKLFAVFKEKARSLPTDPTTEAASSATQLGCKHDGPTLKIRVITPELAKHDVGSIDTIQIPASATVSELRDQVASHLEWTGILHHHGIENECNCSLARKLAIDPASDKDFIVVHGKSEVVKLPLPAVTTNTTLVEVVQGVLKQDVINSKKIHFHGGSGHSSSYNDQVNADGNVENTFTKTPVIAVCSKQRHIPAMAKSTIVPRQPGAIKRTLDLHTSELPISQACNDLQLSALHLDELAVDGIIDIFAVNRAFQNEATIVGGTGKGIIYRDHVHWEPSVKQSERGIAMFLASLRVFVSIVEEMSADDPGKDAVYHVFDLLARFPPALRTLHILIEGKTPTAVEAAALAHSVLEVIEGFMPKEIIGNDRSRLFEGSRLLFGFILEKARTVKLGEDDATSLPYLSSFKLVDVRDIKTREPVFHAIHSDSGLIEKALFEALTVNGVLSNSNLQSHLQSVEGEPTTQRVAFCSGGVTAEAITFSARALASNYKYSDGGKSDKVFDISELRELHHLAELCGRNKLAVHRPGQLTSAVAPSLTFDRDAHLAVYTGQLPCSMPGKSSEIFRPKKGEETIDEAIVEQLIAPVLKTYEADGTAVFDLLGGASVRRMQEPDEVVMFAVDCSSSMRLATDFADVNDVDIPIQEPTAQTIVEPEYYNRTSFDDLKDIMSRYEAFDDMIAIIGEAVRTRQRRVATAVIELLRLMLSAEIVDKQSRLELIQQRFRYARQTALEGEMDRLKAFWAALQTHEGDLCDFLIFRANTSPDLGRRWRWFPGEQLPARSTAGHLPSLSASITEVPDDFLCPISHGLMEEAVKAADNFTYSRQAIEEWFRIRSTSPTSPMTGLTIANTRHTPNDTVSNGVASWIQGEDILRAPNAADPSMITLHFNSRVGKFQRRVSSSITLQDLYKLVFRGLKARFLVFQLSVNQAASLPSGLTLAASGIKHGQEIDIRIADDADMSVSAATGTSATTQTEMCLIKVYHGHRMAFSYWVKRDTSNTMRSILWKYWRYRFSNNQLPSLTEQAVWTDMETTGDGMFRGSSNSPEHNLATYLTRAHCSGTLQDEPLCRVDDSNPEIVDLFQPLVLKVNISQPWSRTSRARDAKLSRLDVLKQMFEALINRVLAYSYKTHIGLVTFASDARVKTGITHVLENFRRATADMEADGDTALWDAIALCKDQLDQYKGKFPKAKLRIIVISDGANTKTSTHSAAELTWELSQAKIALDSVILGNEENEDLRAISYFLGCYRFRPTSLPNALLTCELEPFLSLTERPAISPPVNTPRHRYSFLQNFFLGWLHATYTPVSQDRVPERIKHPNANDSVIALAAASAMPMRAAATGGSRTNLRVSRLMNEMRTIVANGAHPKYDIYVSESDMSYWKVVMSGPDDSPYSAGTFLLYLHAGPHYPTFAPDARFITKIKHPNVNAHGRICHALLSRDWTSDTSMSTVLDTIYGLLLQAETSDPVNTAATLGYHHDQVEYAEEVREYVDQFASKSREEWKEELLEEYEDVDDEDEEDDEDEDEVEEDEEDDDEDID